MRLNYFFAELLLLGGILFFPLAAPRLYTVPPEEKLSPAKLVSPVTPVENAGDGVAPNTGAGGPPFPGPASLARAFYGGPGKNGGENPGPKDPSPAQDEGEAPLSGPEPGTKPQATEALKYVGRIRDGENRERLYIKDARTGDLITVETEGTNEGKYRLLENTPDTLVLAADDLVYLIKKEQP
jgi:hypothetical protein